MNRYQERLINILQLKKLTNNDKLELAFEEQAYNEAISLMDLGANPQIIIDESKKLGGWKMSMLQDDLVKEAKRRIVAK